MKLIVEGAGLRRLFELRAQPGQVFSGTCRYGHCDDFRRNVAMQFDNAVAELGENCFAGFEEQQDFFGRFNGVLQR